MVSTVDKEIVRGDSRTMDIFVAIAQETPQDPSGGVDLTGATIIFTMKKWRTDGKPVHADPPSIRKTSEDSSEIEITGAAGEAVLYLRPEDTKWLDPGTYVYDVKVHLAGEVFTVQMGRIYLVAGVGSAEDTTTP